MRHSDIALTMNTYTDERLLETSGAVELLPNLPIGPGAESSVAPAVAPTAYKRSQEGSKPGKMGGLADSAGERKNPEKHSVLRGSEEWAIQNSNL